MRQRIGDVLRRLAQRVDGRKFAPVQSFPITIGAGGGGGAGGFGVYAIAGGSKPKLPRKEDRFADPEEAMRIASRLAREYATLLERLSDYDGPDRKTG